MTEKVVPFIEFGKIAEFRNGLNFSKDSHGAGCKIIGVADFQNNFTPNYDSLEELNPEGITKEDDYLKKGDIIFVRSNGNKALVGRSLYIDRDVNALFSGFCIRARLISDIIDPLFLAYYTRTNHFKSSISSVAGTNINNLNQDILSNVKLPLYTKDVQLSITNVLSALDAKIELNQRINTELESMAKTLYDYWFVQFDFPNEKGKPYKSAGGEMVWNEELKREIPLGWEVKKVGDFANTSSGGTPLSTKQEYYGGGTIPWINSGELNDPFIVKGSSFITEEGLNNSSAKIFPANTVLVALYGATAGKVSLLRIEACTNQAVCGIIPSSQIYINFLKYSFENLYKYMVAISSGSARDNLSQDIIRNITFAMPQDEKLFERFNKIVNPMLEKIVSNLLENQTLSSLRDWLLPMLMNGQVKVG